MQQYQDPTYTSKRQRRQADRNSERMVCARQMRKFGASFNGLRKPRASFAKYSLTTQSRTARAMCRETALRADQALTQETKSPRSCISGGLLRQGCRVGRDQWPLVVPLDEVVAPPTVNVLPDDDVLPEEDAPPDVLAPPGVKVEPPAPPVCPEPCPDCCPFPRSPSRSPSRSTWCSARSSASRSS